MLVRSFFKYLNYVSSISNGNGKQSGCHSDISISMLTFLILPHRNFFQMLSGKSIKTALGVFLNKLHNLWIGYLMRLEASTIRT